MPIAFQTFNWKKIIYILNTYISSIDDSGHSDLTVMKPFQLHKCHVTLICLQISSHLF